MRAVVAVIHAVNARLVGMAGLAQGRGVAAPSAHGDFFRAPDPPRPGPFSLGWARQGCTNVGCCVCLLEPLSQYLPASLAGLVIKGYFHAGVIQLAPFIDSIYTGN